jgi:hypothetical protein
MCWVKIEGTALDEPAVQQLAAELGPRLALLGLSSVEAPEVQRRTQGTGIVYGFTLRCPRAPGGAR